MRRSRLGSAATAAVVVNRRCSSVVMVAGRRRRLARKRPLSSRYHAGRHYETRRLKQMRALCQASGWPNHSRLGPENEIAEKRRDLACVTHYALRKLGVSA